MDYQKHFQSDRHIGLTYGLTFSRVFLVLMPLNTTFDQKTATVRRFSRFCSIKLHVVMSVFASHVASSDRSVMILIFLEYVEACLCISDKYID